MNRRELKQMIKGLIEEANDSGMAKTLLPYAKSDDESLDQRIWRWYNIMKKALIKNLGVSDASADAIIGKDIYRFQMPVDPSTVETEADDDIDYDDPYLNAPIRVNKNWAKGTLQKNVEIQADDGNTWVMGFTDTENSKGPKFSLQQQTK